MAFPRISIVGSPERVAMLSRAAARLGLEIAEVAEIVIDAGHSGTARGSYAVIVARSEHGQVSVWPVVEVDLLASGEVLTCVPASGLDSERQVRLQRRALEEVHQRDLLGVATIWFDRDEVVEVEPGPGYAGCWTIDGSTTDQYEQHLRGLLNLPLGDPSLLADVIVTSTFCAGDKPDMYYPYLHLFARDPGLRVYQYRLDPVPGATIGHVSVLGKNRDELIERVTHAAEYFRGVIDE